MVAVEEAPRGVLGPRAEPPRFEVARTRPGPDLAELVEHYWTVRWDLRGRGPHTQHTLPHPSVHLVAERGRSGVMGVLTGRFTRELRRPGPRLRGQVPPGRLPTPSSALPSPP